MEKIKESKAKSIKNFNRVFNTIIITSNLLLLGFLWYLDRQTIIRYEDSRSRFLKMAYSLQAFSCCLSFALLAIIQFFNKENFKAIAISNNIMFSVFFQVISGLLRSYLFQTSDPLLFVISLEIVLRYVIINSNYSSYKIMTYSSIWIIIYQWLSMLLYHKHVPITIIYYNIIQTMVLIMLTAYTKVLEKAIHVQAELMNAKENERNYYINILDNINYGFFIVQGSKISMFNKNIRSLMLRYFSSKDVLRELGTSFDEPEATTIQSLNNDEHSTLINSTNLEWLSYLKLLIEEPNTSKENILSNGTLEVDDDSMQVEDFIEILLSSFNTFIPKTNANLIRILRSSSNKKLPILKHVLSKLKEFTEFTKIGRVKLIMNNNEVLFFDLSFRMTKRDSFDSSANEVLECIINDVTQTLQIEKDKSDIKFKSILLAKIAHEFKNPINTINALCSTLNLKIAQDPDLMSKFKKMQNISENKVNNLNFIASLCDYLLFLIEDLNSFVKISIDGCHLKKDNDKNPDKEKDRDRGDTNSSYSDNLSSNQSDRSFHNKMTNLNLTQLLDFCYNIFNIRQNYDKCKPCLRIIRNYSPDLPKKFFTNETKLKQILINLLSNAYKFTISGCITLGANYNSLTKSITFSVTDTGTGISKEELRNLFKPFGLADRNQQFNCNGSGLGLSIVKDILTQFSSKISVISEPNKGSCFSFELEHIDKLNLEINEQIMENELEENNEDDDEIPCLEFKGIRREETATENKQIFGVDDKSFREPDTNSDDDHRSRRSNSVKSGKTEEIELYVSKSDFHKRILREYKKSYSLQRSIDLSSFTPFRKECSSRNILSSGKQKKANKKKYHSFDMDNKLKDKVFKVLICDSDKTTGEKFATFLAKLGQKAVQSVDVKVLSDGMECIYHIYKENEENNKINILLLGENLNTLSGFELSEILKKQTGLGKLQSIPIYLLLEAENDRERTSVIYDQGKQLIRKPLN